VCAWHYGCESHDWPRITRVLDDWRCVTQQINAVRRVLVEQPSNGKAHDAILRVARDELSQVAPQWGLEPAEHEPESVASRMNTHHRAGASGTDMRVL